MIKIKYTYKKNSEKLYGEYLLDAYLERHERFPITDNYRIELFLKTEYPDHDIIVIDTYRV